MVDLQFLQQKPSRAKISFLFSFHCGMFNSSEYERFIDGILVLLVLVSLFVHNARIELTCDWELHRKPSANTKMVSDLVGRCAKENSACDAETPFSEQKQLLVIISLIMSQRKLGTVRSVCTIQTFCIP